MQELTSKVKNYSDSTERENVAGGSRLHSYPVKGTHIKKKTCRVLLQRGFNNFGCRYNTRLDHS